MPGMNTEISPTLLRSISKDLSNGRPCWAILRANEYLASGDPLRLAFVAKAKQQLGGSVVKLPAVRKALSGEKINQIDAELEGYSLLRSEKSTATAVRSVPTAKSIRRARAGRAASVAYKLAC